MDTRNIYINSQMSSRLYGALSTEGKKTSYFNGLESKPIMLKRPEVALQSNYSQPIYKQPFELAGYGRGAGQASDATQREVMLKIAQASDHLPMIDRALLLSIAKVESGFNPDAAATSTSASGVFQLVKRTANSLGLEQKDVFDADRNVEAGIKLFEENSALVSRKYPQLSGTERSVMLYAIHHDGPGLQYGGEKIARERIIPELPIFYEALSKLEAGG